jgi:cell division septal protein FtsQ
LDAVKWLRGTVGLVVAVIVIAFISQRFVGDKEVAPRLVSSEPVAAIGSGSSAVAVAADGTILAWLPPPKEGSLPKLPLETPPKGPRLQGPVLEQARVLGAAPAGLRRYIEGSYFGESGVDINLTSGIELRFGDSTQLARKWRAAAAVLASPSVTTLDYVDLHAPARPAIHGSGHTLPPPP